jgi:hypothetical protein
MVKTAVGSAFWRGICFGLVFSIPLWGAGAWGGGTTYPVAWHPPKRHHIVTPVEAGSIVCRHSHYARISGHRRSALPCGVRDGVASGSDAYFG